MKYFTYRNKLHFNKLRFSSKEQLLKTSVYIILLVCIICLQKFNWSLLIS